MTTGQGPEGAIYFALFNEIGIIEQLARTLLERQLPPDLIAPHFTVLNHLVRVGDGRTPQDIARAFQVPKTTLTHTLAGLESAGLVQMRRNPDDGRSKQVWLTPAGRSLRDSVIAAMGPDFARLARSFPPDQVAALLPALTALRKWLDEHRAGENRAGG